MDNLKLPSFAFRLAQAVQKVFRTRSEFWNCIIGPNIFWVVFRKKHGRLQLHRPTCQNSFKSLTGEPFACSLPKAYNHVDRHLVQRRKKVFSFHQEHKIELKFR